MKTAIVVLVLSLTATNIACGQWLPPDPPKGPFLSCVDGKTVTTTLPPKSKLGISYAMTDKSFMRTLHVPVPTAAFVTTVARGSVAEAAGIHQGDVILRAAEKALTSVCDLPVVIDATKPGTSIPMEIWRDSAKLTLKARF